MKVLIVSCPVWSHMNPPLSLAILQAHLKDHGVDVEVMDQGIEMYKKERQDYERLSKISNLYREKTPGPFHLLTKAFSWTWDRYTKKILKSEADIICFSTYKTNLLPSLIIAKKIKKTSPEKKIIFGGPAVYNKYTKKYVKGTADKIITGAGEDALLKELKIKKKKYDINKEPTPDFTGMDIKSYRHKEVPYSTTRGCMNKCDFCFDHLYWKGFSFKKADKIFNDLKTLKKKTGCDTFLFSDSNILGTRKNINDFCNLVIKNNLKIKWSGQISCNIVDKETLEKMKRAGCTRLSFGIESGSEEVLKLMNKHQTIDHIQNTIKDASKAGINVTGLFMVGYPGETWKDFFKTARFINANKTFFRYIGISPTSIYMGTPLHRKAKKLGIKNRSSFFWHKGTNNIITRMIKLKLLQRISKDRLL